MSEMRSPLGRVRGLGSANEGVGHWWSQRLSSIALIPLSLWFIGQLPKLGGADFEAYAQWVGHHGNTTMLVLLILVTFHHAYQGVQVVIEDYVHAECTKVGCLIAAKFAAVFFAVAAVTAVLKVAFGG